MMEQAGRGWTGTMAPTQLHEDNLLRILWHEQTGIIALEWKAATSSMSDEDFKAELTLFAGCVEKKKAPRILVDVTKFRHKMAPDLQQWRVENISSRYNAAGVKRFAFLFPKESPLPPMPESSDGEAFLTRPFSGSEQAIAWLTVNK
jgi:hypothetical protein